MNNILMKFENELLDHFKATYRQCLNKSAYLTYELILNSTLKELQYPHYQGEELLSLKSWFHKVYDQTFILDLLVSSFQEIIVHSACHAQRINNNEKHNLEINNISDEEYQLSLETLCLKNNITWNYKEPFVSFNITMLDKNLRLTLIHNSASSTKKSKMFLRFIKKENIELTSFMHKNQDCSLLLKELIEKKANIIVAGSTGSGKTTFLRSLIEMISEEEHLITLEDTYEIINERKNQTSLLADKNSPNKTLKDFCAYALRMSPDRLIVGEIRSNEVVPFILAMNTGHKGLLSSIHANSAVDTLSRLSLLFSLYSESSEIDYKTINKLVCKNIDNVIFIENKKIKEIISLIGSDGENPFYETLYSCPQAL